MIILAIDTSCDETSVAISHDDVILANVISSQVELHKKWGGIVPAIAQRAHKEKIDLVIKEALKRAKLDMTEIDVFAVTYGPGLAIALEVGIAKAKELSAAYGKPLVAVNHMIGHIYANFARNSSGKSAITFSDLQYPVLALLVSGGHTEMVLMKDKFNFKIIGQTLDDAMGEAYDKVAKMLGLGYPGGPVLAKLAQAGDSSKYPFTVPMKNSGDLNFSFSGLKTAVLNTVKQVDHSLAKQEICDLAASFQRVAFEAIIIKLVRAVREHNIKQVLLGGGVITNTDFRRAIRKALRPFGVKVYYPNLKKLCTDNAAMIAIAAHYQARENDYVRDLSKLDRDPSLSI